MDHDNHDRKERIAINKVARVVRAARKQLGLVQEKIANSLDLEQSAWSRIEAGKQMLSAAQWVTFCDLTGVSPDSIVLGYVDSATPAALKQGLREGGFRIPPKYAANRGSKVRATLPLLMYFSSLYGEHQLIAYLRDHGLDPDFFICLDNQISIDFSLELLAALARKGVLKSKNFTRLMKPITQPAIHGTLRYQYEAKKSSLDLVSQLVNNSLFYECNFAYKVESFTKNHLDLSIRPNEHMRETKHLNDPTLGDFLCRYKKHYIEQFIGFSGHRRDAKLVEIECLFKRDDKCVYRVDRRI